MGALFRRRYAAHDECVPPRDPAFIPSFPLTRWREGYDCEEVDAFVQRLRSTPAGAISADQVHQQAFRSVRGGAGYDMYAVDVYLDAVAARVAAGEAAGSVPVPGGDAATSGVLSRVWQLLPLLLTVSAVIGALVALLR